MKELYKLLSLLFLCACGNTTVEPPSQTIMNEQLDERISKVTEWLPYCGKWISKDNCAMGDAVLFAGMLCLSGYDLGCEQVKASCATTDGRCVRHHGDSDGQNSFSRDMAIGVLAYLAKSKDTDTAANWISYIRRNGSKLCTDDTDGRCNITPVLWGLFGEVWQHIGIKPTTNMALGMKVDDRTVRESAASTAKGYPMHLVATQIYIRQMIDRYTSDLETAANTLAIREPNNPYFELLSHGRNDRVIELVLQQAPENGSHAKFQWSIEREHAESAYVHSMGWEWIFIANAIKHTHALSFVPSDVE